jgi:hypothetical protein
VCSSDLLHVLPRIGAAVASGWPAWLERGLVAGAVVAAATWVWLSWCIFPLRSWNDIRLAPSFALTLGLPLYPGADGAASTWMYGPLPVWLNWPATWMPGPGEALLVAGGINAGFQMAAILAVCLGWPTPRSGPVSVWGRLLAAAAVIALWPWANWQFLQADNYALACGLLANLVLARSRGEAGAWGAAVPLGCYIMVLGIVHLRRLPLVISGAVDAICLAAGLSGLAVVGPMALLEPAVGATRWSWAFMGVLALLTLALTILVSRPRLVVYNATVEQLRPAVAEVVLTLDPSARWAGETVAMPSRGLQIHMFVTRAVFQEPMLTLKAVTLTGSL